MPGPTVRMQRAVQRLVLLRSSKVASGVVVTPNRDRMRGRPFVGFPCVRRRTRSGGMYPSSRRASEQQYLQASAALNGT